MRKETPTAEGTATGAGVLNNQSTFASTNQTVQASSAGITNSLHETANFIYDSANYQSGGIAQATAIGLISVIASAGYYTETGAGLNQFICVLADTGLGKEAIALGISKLFEAISRSVPSITEFKGPAHIASAPGLLKWLAAKPVTICVVGEFTNLLLRVTDRRASAIDRSLGGCLLDTYAKSAWGASLDALAYSDTVKNVDAIRSPKFTLIGETNPAAFYEALDERMIESGLLSRFLHFDFGGERRPYLNPQSRTGVVPSPALVQALADLTAYSLTLRHNNTPYLVPVDSEARAALDGYERQTTDAINGAGSDASKQLWNRAYLKALKLATLNAIGRNYLHPVVNLQDVVWATSLITSQTTALLSKFANDEVGEVAGDEAKQINALLFIIGEYAILPYEKLPAYSPPDTMHLAGTITESYIAQRVMKWSAFSKDRAGPTRALKRAIQHLLESDDLKEIPKSQMQLNFGTAPRAFVVANPTRFIDAFKRGRVRGA